MWRKPQKNKKSKEGRHVGFDFYDLLIEALRMPGSNALITSVAFDGEHRAGRAIDDKALTILLQHFDNSLKHPR
jgi:hypothetical protein